MAEEVVTPTIRTASFSMPEAVLSISVRTFLVPEDMSPEDAKAFRAKQDEMMLWMDRVVEYACGTLRETNLSNMLITRPQKAWK